MRSWSRLPVTESNYSHFERDDVAREYAAFDFLLPAEAVVFDGLERSGVLSDSRVLDIGIGGGRTTAHLLGRCAAYVGMDVSEAMVDATRARTAADTSPPSLTRADARSLPFPARSFDVVLFSFNGLDGVGDHEERLHCLREIRRVCAPGAAFVFSSDNLCFVEQRLSPTRLAAGVLRNALSGETLRVLRRRSRSLPGHLVRPLRVRLCNPSARQLRKVDHAGIVVDRYRYEMLSEAHTAPGERIRLPGYCIRPTAQVHQLTEVGFEEVRAFAPDGSEVTADLGSGLADHMWLYYRCRADGGGHRE